MFWLGFHKDIKKSYRYSTEEPFPCRHCREGHQQIPQQSYDPPISYCSSQVQQTVSTYCFKLPYVGSFTREAQKRLRKRVRGYCTNIKSQLFLFLRLVVCSVLKILFLSISVRALSTGFHVQDVIPVASARLAGIS